MGYIKNGGDEFLFEQRQSWMYASMYMVTLRMMHLLMQHGLYRKWEDECSRMGVVGVQLPEL